MHKIGIHIKTEVYSSTNTLFYMFKWKTWTLFAIKFMFLLLLYKTNS